MSNEDMARLLDSNEALVFSMEIAGVKSFAELYVVLQRIVDADVSINAIRKDGDILGYIRDIEAFVAGEEFTADKMLGPAILDEVTIDYGIRDKVEELATNLAKGK